MPGTTNSKPCSWNASALLLLTLSLASCGAESAAVLAADSAALPPTQYKLYFLGGQSNMVGYGYVAELSDELNLETDDAMIFTGRTAGDNEAGGGVGRWERLRPGHGLEFDTDGKTNSVSARFGPELSFGRTMTRLSPGTKIAIVKYAKGGSALFGGAGYGNWEPDFVQHDGINQYDHALTTLRNALSQTDIDADGNADILLPSGIIWMQGESDAYESATTAAAYEGNLKRMMDLLRAALRVDDLPVMVGRITDSGMDDDGRMMDYIETVQAAQTRFAGTDACAALVTVTEDLDYLEDGWHYTTDGYLRLGTAFARAARKLEDEC